MSVPPLAAPAPTPAAPFAIDASRWYYRYGYVGAAHWLARYHRTRVRGTPADPPCIYLAHHGAGYLVLDLVVAAYEVAWRRWYARRGPATPLRIVGARGNAMERAIPGLGAAKRQAGMIDPTETAAIAVLERGEPLLITPGGRREATPAARDYRLRWRDRYGFVRIALHTGAPIVPLAVVGGFEAFPGFARGKLSFWSPLPLPVRLDVVIGEPIAVPRSPERARDAAVVVPLHERAWRATQALYDTVLAERRRPSQR
ncbi:MAG: glycerol acyltransferase [Gemmatimonadales bacterium]